MPKNGRDFLRRYMREHGLTQADLVRAGPFDDAEVSRWYSGKRKPGLAKAVRLEQVTDGKVPAQSWVS